MRYDSYMYVQKAYNLKRPAYNKTHIARVMTGFNTTSRLICAVLYILTKVILHFRTVSPRKMVGSAIKYSVE